MEREDGGASAGAGASHDRIGSSSNTTGEGQSNWPSSSSSSTSAPSFSSYDNEPTPAPAPASLSSSNALNWRLSAHPIILLFFLAFKIAGLLTYLFGLLFTDNFVLIFILAVLLLAFDFYLTKNIAGRRLVGLRWWSEVGNSTDRTAGSESRWVFESAHPDNRIQNATDRRFFWLTMYAQPLLWIGLAIIAIVKFEFVWLSLVVIALILTITNTLAFTRADRFSHAAGLASTAISSSGMAKELANGFITQIFAAARRSSAGK